MMMARRREAGMRRGDSLGLELTLGGTLLCLRELMDLLRSVIAGLVFYQELFTRRCCL